MPIIISYTTAESLPDSVHSIDILDPQINVNICKTEPFICLIPSIEKSILQESSVPTAKKQIRKRQPDIRFQVGAQVEMRIKSRRKYIWTSDDPEIATLSPKGMLKTLKPGKTRLVARWAGASA